LCAYPRPSQVPASSRGLQTIPIQLRGDIALDCYFKPKTKVFLCGDFSGPMDNTEISSYDGVREFSYFQSRSSLFAIRFQYVSLDTTNNNKMSSSVWLARQLQHKSDEIHRLRQQTRAHQMNLQQANQKVASLVEQLGEALQSVSETDPTPSPAIFFSIVSATRGRGDIRGKHSSGLNMSMIFPRPHGMSSLRSSLFRQTL
jgi:hypothetical protein